MENFTDKITGNYPNIKILDTSKADLKIITDEEGENGHVWTNIENYKKQVTYIAEKLMEEYPENKELYENNLKIYLNKLEELKPYKADTDEYVISCNEALAYMLDEANLNVISVYTDHDESSLSSGDLANVIEEVKEKNIKAIFIEKNDDLKNAQLISNETGAKIVTLDAGLTGKESKDSYINAMKENLNKIKDVFETEEI